MTARTPLAAAAAAALAFAGSAGADVLVDFDFAGAGDINEAMPFSGGGTTVADDVDLTSGLQLGAGLDPVGGTGGGTSAGAFRFNGVADVVGETPGLAEAVADGEFFAFTAAPEAGSMLDLSGGSVVLENIAKEGNGGRAPDSFALLTSVDGFDSADVVDSETGVGFGAQTITLDLPDTADFEALSGPVEFRVYVYRSTAATNVDFGGGGAILSNNSGAGVQLNGEVVAIPEPASAAAAMGLLGLAALRRRR